VTTIVVGPAERFSRALTEALDDLVVIDTGTSVDTAIWQVLLALQTAHVSMEPGGRIVVIVPTIGMAGAAGLVDCTTVIEGIRAMAKSAARQWGSARIGVNMIAAPLSLFAVDGGTSHLSAAAVQDDRTLIHSIVETAKFLLRNDLDHLTGETIVVDGGSVMLP
jgi:3-oxoacyl-[acyl-carrier protein] reductase